MRGDQEEYVSCFKDEYDGIYEEEEEEEYRIQKNRIKYNGKEEDLEEEEGKKEKKEVKTESIDDGIKSLNDPDPHSNSGDDWRKPPLPPSQTAAASTWKSLPKKSFGQKNDLLEQRLSRLSLESSERIAKSLKSSL